MSDIMTPYLASLVRRLDVALNGDGAAPQASLCDLVGQCEGIARATGRSVLTPLSPARATEPACSASPNGKHSRSGKHMRGDWCEWCSEHMPQAATPARAEVARVGDDGEGGWHDPELAPRKSVSILEAATSPDRQFDAAAYAALAPATGPGANDALYDRVLAAVTDATPTFVDPVDNSLVRRLDLREREAIARAALTEASAQPSSPWQPIELRGIAETLDEGSGFWRACSGCHELDDGHDTGPYSETLRCVLGGGCAECGGIGAVWDATDYAAMADALAANEGERAA